MKHKTADILLFEYGDWHNLDWKAEQIARFEVFLEEVWENRSRSGILAEWYKAEDEPLNQPLVQIKHKRFGKNKVTYAIRANNYVGIIRFEGHTFHVLPKLFKNHSKGHVLQVSNAHLLWWLSYNRWLNLPKQVTSLSYQRCDFLEILIHLFTTYTLAQIQKGVYQTYQEVEAETTYLKGQLLFNEYTSQYLGRANYQKMYCRYDSFEIDNQLNRIIKYVCRQLMAQSTIAETRRTLSRIINLLNEVKDVVVSDQNCDQVVLNKMFKEYQMVLDYCKMFLRGNQTQTTDKTHEAFAFLVPMEKVFEEFVLGFLQRELKDHIKVTGQYQRKYLTTNNKFRLRPDLLIQVHQTSKSFIADSKYKLIYEGSKGISQSDLYQMLAYAVRHKADQIKLFYPNWTEGTNKDFSRISIRDEFTSNVEVHIDINQVHIAAVDHEKWNQHVPIRELFKEVKKQLKKEFIIIFT